MLQLQSERLLGLLCKLDFVVTAFEAMYARAPPLVPDA
jgi:hypothetical protein